MTASLYNDLSSITPLVIALLIFVAIWIFRKEIKLVLTRLSRIEAKRKGTTVSAELEKRDRSAENESESPGRAADEPPDEKEAEKDNEPVVAASPTPLTDNLADLRNQMVDAYLAGKEPDGDEKYERLQQLESDPTERKRDHLRQLAAMFIGGADDGALKKLEEQVTDDEVAGFAFRMIGSCLEASQKPLEAASAYEKSLELEDDQVAGSEAARLRAMSLSEAGFSEKAIAELTNLLPQFAGESRVEILDGLAEAYERTDEQLYRALMLHESAKIVGNDPRRWFRAGYAYAQADREGLSVLVIHCYQTALTFDSGHGAALNNLGVALLQADLKLLGTARYVAAADHGHTLAMANMAQNYLKLGFEKDAERLIKKALDYPSPDPKVARANSELATGRKKESERLDQILKDGQSAARFMSEYSSSLFSARPPLPAQMFLGDKNVEVKIDGESVVLIWQEGAIASHRRFIGRLIGAAISGKFEKEDFSPSAHIAWKADGNGYGKISESGASIHIIKFKSDRAVEQLAFESGSGAVAQELPSS